MGYSGAGGNWPMKKNQKQKISWHCPFSIYLFRNSRRAVSVNDIRRAFEKAEQSLSNSGTRQNSASFPCRLRFFLQEFWILKV